MSTALVTASQLAVLPPEYDRELYFQEHGGKLQDWLTKQLQISCDVCGVVASYLVGPRSINEFNKVVYKRAQTGLSQPIGCCVSPRNVDVVFEKFYNVWPTICWKHTLPAPLPEEVMFLYFPKGIRTAPYTADALREIAVEEFSGCGNCYSAIQDSKPRDSVYYVCMPIEPLKTETVDGVTQTAQEKLAELQKAGAPCRVPRAVEFLTCHIYHQATTGTRIVGMSLIEEQRHRKIVDGEIALPLTLGRPTPDSVFLCEAAEKDSPIAPVFIFPAEPTS